MAKFIANMTWEQATCRVHFNALNPTNLHKKDRNEYVKAMKQSDDDFDEAFLISELLLGEVPILLERSIRRGYA